MSSVDNRIVILSFDNKDFEKNVQTSMNTLDKLKNNLDLSQSSKGLTALAASAKSFDLGPMGRAIESIKERFSGLGIVGMTVLQNLTNTAVDFGKRLVSATIGPLTSGGWKRALNIEQATFQMEGLIGKTEGGAQKIEAIMASVKESVQGTAYGMDEAARVASQLVATGIEDSQLMLKYLQGVAGAAAMTGGAYDEIGHIFTTVAGNGRLMGDQLQQFAYRGLNVAATLSKQMGITEQEFRQLVTKGQISFEQFAEGMAEAFGEHATKANETFTGSLSNMRAALARIGEEFATPALKYFRDIFYSLKLLIDQVHARLKPLIDLINKHLTSNAGKFVDFIDSITEALGGESQRMKKEAEEAAEVTEETAQRVTKSTEEIEAAAKRVIAGEFGNGVETRREKLAALGLSFEEVQNKVNELLGNEYRYEIQTEEVAEASKQAADETENLAEAVDAPALKTAKQVFQDLHLSLGNVWLSIKQVAHVFKSSLNKAISGQGSANILNGIERVSKAFKSFTQSLMLNGTEMKGLSKIIDGVFKALGYLLQGALKGVEYFFKFLAIIGNLKNSFLEFIGSLHGANDELDETSRKAKFLEAFSGVVEKLGSVFTAFKDKIKEVFERVKNTGGFIKLKDTLQQLWETIKEIAGKVFDKVIEKMEKFAGTEFDFSWLDSIVSILGKAAGKLADFFSWINNSIPKVQEFFASLKDGSNTGVFGTFINFLLKAKDAVVGFFTGLTSGEGGEVNLFSSIKDIFQNGLNNIGEFFSNLSTTGFVEGFKTFIGNIIASAGEIDIESAIDFLKKVGKLVAEIIGFIALIKLTKSLTSFFNGLGGFFSDITGLKAIADAEKTKLVLVAIGEIIAALYIISKMEPEDLKRSVIALGAILGGIMAAFIIINRLPMDDSKMKNFAVSMAGLGVGLLAMSVAAKVLASMDLKEFASSAAKLAVLVAMLVGASRLAGSVKAAAAFMGLAVAVNLLVPALFILGHMKWSTIETGAKAIGIIALELGLAARLAGNVKAAAAFMGLALAVDLIVPAFLLLGKIKWKTIKQGAIALGIIVAELALACRIASSEHSGKGAAALLAMALTIIAATASLMILGKMPRDQLISGAIALGSIVAAVGIAAKLSENADAGSILSMAGVLVLATMALYILKDVPWENLAAGAAALSAIMLSLAAASNIAKDSEADAESLAAMLIPLAGATIALYFLKDADWKSLIAGGAALSMVVLALSAAMKIANGAKGSMIDGAAALLIMSIALIPAAASIALLAKYDWKGLLGAATALSEVVLACSVALAICANLNPGFVVAGAVGLGLGIDILLGLISGFSALMGHINELTDQGFVKKIEEGAKVFKAAGEAIGGFVGGIVEGAGEGVSNTLEDIGKSLYVFSELARPFMELCGQYGLSAVGTIGGLAAGLGMLVGADFLDGIGKLLTGESSLKRFGEELAEFGPALNTFADSITFTAAAKAQIAADALTALATAAKSIPNSGGLLGKIVGNNNLGDFSKSLPGFGRQIKAFSDNAEGINVDNVKNGAEALSAIASAAKEIPNQGLSVLRVIFGDNKLGDFGPQLAGAGEALKSFATSADGVTGESVKGPAEALVIMCRAAKEIPNQGWSALRLAVGDNKLGDFGLEMAKFGVYLAAFAEATDGITLGSVIQAVAAAKVALTLGDSAPKSGGLFGLLKGSNSLGKFGGELAEFGPGLATFATSLQGVSTSKINTLAYAMPSIAEMVNAVNETGYSQLDGFGQALSSFGGYIADYSNNIADVDPDKLNTVISGMYRLSGLAQSLSGNGDAISSFSDIFKSAGKNSVSEFTNSFADVGDAADAVEGFISSVTPDMSGFEKEFSKAAENAIKNFKDTFSKSQSSVTVSVAGFIAYAQSSLAQSAVSLQNTFQSVANKAATQFVSGLSSRNPEAYSAGSGLASAAYSGLSNSAGDWSSIGVNCALGFANGVGSWYAVQVACQNAANLVNATKRRAQSEAQQASPSKVFYEIGYYCVLGFANAFHDGAKLSAKRGGELVAETIKEARLYSSKLQNALDFELNIDPVITPVLDLTNVTAGANQINSMFGRAPIGLDLNNATLMGNLAMMSSGFASGDTGNEDVVDAINGLKGGMNNMTFNITVDGAENPEDFVDRMVRALKSRSRI